MIFFGKWALHSSRWSVSSKCIAACSSSWTWGVQAPSAWKPSSKRLEMKKTPETKLQCHGEFNRLTLSEPRHTSTDSTRLSQHLKKIQSSSWGLSPFFSHLAQWLWTYCHGAHHFQQSGGGTFLVFFLALWFQSHLSFRPIEHSQLQNHNWRLPRACYEPVTGSFLRFLFLLIFFLLLPWFITVVWLHMCVCAFSFIGPNIAWLRLRMQWPWHPKPGAFCSFWPAQTEF